MGQTLSEPKTDKTTEKGKNINFAYGISSMQGWRLTMEDAHCVELDINNTKASFFGVYDGHGGSTIAVYTGQKLHHRVVESEQFKKKEYEKAMVEAYKNLDKDIYEDESFSEDPSGCTAVTALITPDQKSVFVANAGDSRCIISINGKNKPLSYDHKPTDPKESQRIVNAGGFVEFGRVNGNLSLSRAIGDFQFKNNKNLSFEEQAVTCNPDVIEHTFTDQDEFIVLACDGIWDCMTNQQVADYVRSRLAEEYKLDEICEKIMDDCLAPESDAVGCDNMSVIIIAVLNGKTEEEWYEWMIDRVTPKKDALGNDLPVKDTKTDSDALLDRETPVEEDSTKKTDSDAIVP